MTTLREAAQQALEALEYRDGDGADQWKADVITALRAALAQQAEPVECSNTFGCRCPKHFAAQQAEPDHETRAELAEQQVVQLAEERDHYRGLWQKAQQAEPVASGCRVMVCGVDCHPGDQHCNNYCTGKADDPPAATTEQAAAFAAKQHRERPSCDECGKSKKDGWALYCVGCLEKAFAPPQRKPLTEEMEARCPYAKANPTLRGAFFDGWLNSERAHGIKE